MPVASTSDRRCREVLPQLRSNHLQTYGAALVFCPTRSQTKSALGGKTEGKTIAGLGEDWDSSLQTLKGHIGAWAVAFSPTGEAFASAFG
jgi:hypothetical protein